MAKKVAKKAAARKKAPAKKKTGRTAVSRKQLKKSGKKPAVKKWSARVTQTSDALDLQSSVFRSKDPVKVARSLKRSADRSKRRKGTPLQSAMSMLNFYVNRAGKNLPATQKRILTKAKGELRKLYGKKDQ
jgi:hypothetical protein